MTLGERGKIVGGSVRPFHLSITAVALPVRSAEQHYIFANVDIRVPLQNALNVQHY